MKYVCYGEHVISRRDGDYHWISAHKLPALYGAAQKDCVFVNGPSDSLGRDFSKLIALRPRWDGNYELPIIDKAKAYKWNVRIKAGQFMPGIHRFKTKKAASQFIEAWKRTPGNNTKTYADLPVAEKAHE